MADGFLPVQRTPETGWLISFLYPMRGAECLGVIAAMGLIAWIFAVLVPEYGLQAMADASSMGASLIGKLFVMIAVLPSVILGPMSLSYWLQYLGRVLVFSAMGDCVPPRTPDRNFDGLLNGLSPWFVWLVMGLGVGLGPAAWWAFAGNASADAIPWAPLVLAAAGLPYILTALMLSFLHDRATAVMPWDVLSGLARLGGSFFGLCAVIAAAFGIVGAGLASILWVRTQLFWPYLLIALGWCIGFLWCQVAVMRLLGVFYFHRKDSLRWNRAHPRWGVAWRS
jgi:hypothetical protein